MPRQRRPRPCDAPHAHPAGRNRTWARLRRLTNRRHLLPDSRRHLVQDRARRALLRRLYGRPNHPAPVESIPAGTARRNPRNRSRARALAPPAKDANHKARKRRNVPQDALPHHEERLHRAPPAAGNRHAGTPQAQETRHARRGGRHKHRRHRNAVRIMARRQTALRRALHDQAYG